MPVLTSRKLESGRSVEGDALISVPQPICEQGLRSWALSATLRRRHHALVATVYSGAAGQGTVRTLLVIKDSSFKETKHVGSWGTRVLVKEFQGRRRR